LRSHWLGYATLILIAGLLQTTEGVAVEHPSPGRFEEAIQAFADADQARRPPAGGAVFVGSSSIRLWDLSQSFPGLPVVNRGFGGSILADATHFADQVVIQYQPKLVVLYAGDNDIALGLTPKQVAADYGQFVAKVRDALPNTRIAYIAIKPSLQRWRLVDKIRAANAAIRRITEGDPLQEFIDIDTPMIGADGLPRMSLFVDDGLHLSAEGYALWTSLVKPKVLAALQPK
jgi:lysophospholipase L1-like esterase